MNSPKVILQVNTSLDGRITFMPNTTMFTVCDQSLQDFQTNFSDWNEFNTKAKALHEVDFSLEGCNMLVTETDELTLLPACDKNPELLLKDYLPHRIPRRQKSQVFDTGAIWVRYEVIKK